MVDHIGPRHGKKHIVRNHPEHTPETCVCCRDHGIFTESIDIIALAPTVMITTFTMGAANHRTQSGAGAITTVTIVSCSGTADPFKAP